MLALSWMCLLLVGIGLMISVWQFMSSPGQVCYGDLGCFTNEEPFNNAWWKLPESPDMLNISFFLYTRRNDVLAELLNDGTLATSHFNSSENTKIIVHGMGESAWDPWPQELKRVILSQDHVNVIVVNWHDGAGTFTNPFTYLQAVANTRVVGAVVAKLIHILKNVTGASFGSFHLIGHSLGGHVVGYAGKRVDGLARITGLDPANIMFDGYGARVGLSRSDAEFIDVIHTDVASVYALGFGTLEARGHADFYPNAGSQTGACGSKLHTFTKLFLGDFWGAVATAFCGHVKSVAYFIESVRGVNYTAYPCDSSDDFYTGRCTHCHGECHQMGYHSDRGKPNGTYYLLVNPS